MSEKILVTGAAGYIGRHVVDELRNYDCTILAASLSPMEPDAQCRIITHPIFSDDEDTLFEKLGEPDRCIHLAWRDGFNHNSEAHIDDLPKHSRFIRTLMRSGLKSISVMGTMHEIGYWEGPVNENTPSNPLSLYGIAKNTLREISLLESTQSSCNLKWLRGYYILGDDSNNHSVFSKILEAAIRGETTFPFTSGKNQYDFISVDDLARQIVAASMQDDINGIINCCSGHPIPLGQKVEEFISRNKLGIELEYGAFPDRLYDSPAIWGDATAIKNIMASCPK